jgi:sigma-70-like protein
VATIVRKGPRPTRRFDCPRGCGRAFRTRGGLEWHVKNFRGCAQPNPASGQLALDHARLADPAKRPPIVVLPGSSDDETRRQSEILDKYIAGPIASISALGSEPVARPGPKVFTEHVRSVLSTEPWRRFPIRAAPFDARARNSLLRRKYRTLGDIADLTEAEFLAGYSVGRGTLGELRAGIAALIGDPSAWDAVPEGERQNDEDRGEYVFLPAEREALASPRWREALLDRSWGEGKAWARGVSALYRNSHRTLGSLADLTSAEFLADVGTGFGSLEAVRKWIGHALARPEEVLMHAAAQPLRHRLTAEEPGLLDSLSDLLDRVSARDLRFGLRTLPDVPWSDILDRPSHTSRLLLGEARARLGRLAEIQQTPQPLLEELSDVLGTPSRTTQIFSARWGWDGKGRKTLEEVGESFRLTRERIRQITKKVYKRFEGRPAYLPTAEAILRLSDDLGGAAFESDLGELALQRGLVKSPMDVAALASLPYLGLVPEDRFVRALGGAEPVYGTDAQQIAEFKSIGRTVRRELSRRGVVGLGELSAVLEADGIPVSDNEILGYLERLDGVSALLNGRYFWNAADPDSPLLRTIRRPLIGLGPQTLHALARAIRRAHVRRPEYGPRLPISVLKEALAASPFIAEAGGGLYDWIGPARVVSMAPAEAAAVDFLRDHGPAASFTTMRRALEPRGINAVTMSLYLTTSALIQRVSRGIYALAGADLMPSDVERARRETPSRHRRRAAR